METVNTVATNAARCPECTGTTAKHEVWCPRYSTVNSRCPECGFWNGWHDGNCPRTSQAPSPPNPAPTSSPTTPIPSWSVGWLCPACGRGNAPHVGTCPCRPQPPWQPITTC